MKITKARMITFSPTGTGRTVLEGMVEGLSVDPGAHIDLNSPGSIEKNWTVGGDELALIGAPVYGGRIPIEAVQRLRRLKADGTPAVLVVVYGNREFEDALIELRDLTVELGFRPVAGAAFIGEHSFSNDDTPIASGRPDVEDLAKARAFGESVKALLARIQADDEVVLLLVPGDTPYKERGPRRDAAPVVNYELCDKCEICVQVCPSGAITLKDIVTADPTLCIKCCACVKSCPLGALYWEDEGVKRGSQWLFEKCSQRKEPETFILD